MLYLCIFICKGNHRKIIVDVRVENFSEEEYENGNPRNALVRFGEIGETGDKDWSKRFKLSNDILAQIPCRGCQQCHMLPKGEECGLVK